MLVLLSLLINHFWFKKSVLQLLINDKGICYPFVIGSVVGVVTSGIIIIGLKILRSNFNYLNHLKVIYESRFTLIVVICFIVGFSEELFFRAIVQSTTGLIIASLLFTLAHSQFWAVPPINHGKIIFGSVILLMGFIFGILYNTLGYICAASSHMMFDIVLLSGTKYIIKVKSDDEML